VQTVQVAFIAGRIFGKLGYSGDDGRNLWKAAALLHLERISEFELWDACAAAVECNADCPPRYFYKALAEHLEARGADLKAEIRAVRIMPTWPGSNPEDMIEEDVPPLKIFDGMAW